MTKLDATQAKLLAQIKEAKAEYDRWLGRAEAELDVLKNQQKEPLRKLVARAIEGGVPVRQIHLNGLNYKHVVSMTTFLDGGAKLSTDDILRGLRTTAPEQPVVLDALTSTAGKATKPVFEQRNGMAYWTDPYTGEERSIQRVDGPIYFYSMHELHLAELTDEERDWFYNDAKTLMGQEEKDAYWEHGDEPERWADQPDAKMVNR